MTGAGASHILDILLTLILVMPVPIATGGLEVATATGRV